MNIHEVLTYGSVVASNEEFDILVTVNGAYYNVWCGDYSGNYTNTECFATGFDRGLYGQDFAEVVDKAQSILDELLKENEEENE